MPLMPPIEFPPKVESRRRLLILNFGHQTVRLRKNYRSRNCMPAPSFQTVTGKKRNTKVVDMIFMITVRCSSLA